MRKGWEGWGWSAWRREGSGQASLRPSSTGRGLARKMGTGFLAGSVVTGQGATVFNSKRANLDWIEGKNYL